MQNEDEAPQGNRKNQQQLQRQGGQQQRQQPQQDIAAPMPEMPPQEVNGRRIVPVHQSRIKDRPAKVGEKDSSLKIKIELDVSRTGFAHGPLLTVD